LTSADIATFELKPREEDPGSEEAGIRMGTMKRIKGLDGMCQRGRPQRS
jgi:hypothetical protein